MIHIEIKHNGIYYFVSVIIPGRLMPSKSTSDRDAAFVMAGAFTAEYDIDTVIFIASRTRRRTLYKRDEKGAFHAGAEIPE